MWIALDQNHQVGWYMVKGEPTEKHFLLYCVNYKKENENNI